MYGYYDVNYNTYVPPVDLNNYDYYSYTYNYYYTPSYYDYSYYGYYYSGPDADVVLICLAFVVPIMFCLSCLCIAIICAIRVFRRPQEQNNIMPP
jgi:hypothetical protein